MAITNTTLASPTYNGNGATTAFATGFQFLQNADLLVTVTDADGVETVKTITTHYTVTGAGSPSGGTVTFLVAPITGEKVNITSNVTLDQQTDYVEGGSFAASTHETALDKLTKISQQLQAQIDRAIVLPVSNQSVTTTTAPVTAGYVLRVADDATSLDWTNPSTIALGTTVSAFAETLLDDTTAAAARTTLGLGSLSTFNDADPNADRVVFWDDSAGSHAYLTMGSNLAITGTTLDATSTFDIVGLTALAAPAGDDLLPIYDTSATANKKITLVDLITGQTEDATPDASADFVLTYDASATTTKKVKLTNLGSAGTAATQSDQETATSTATYVSPGRQQYHPSAAKAWARWNDSGTIARGYNVTSITDNGTGDFTLNFTTAFSDANYTAVGMAKENTNSIVMVLDPSVAPTTTALRVSTNRSDNAAPTNIDAGIYYCVAFGDQ